MENVYNWTICLYITAIFTETKEILLIYGISHTLPKNLFSHVTCIQNGVMKDK